jgi:hypothetical protein
MSLFGPEFHFQKDFLTPKKPATNCGAMSAGQERQ